MGAGAGAGSMAFEPAPAPSALERLFPHFISLAALRARHVSTAVDYLGQFSDSPAGGAAAAAGVYVQPPPAARQRGGKGGGGGRKGGGRKGGRARKQQGPCNQWRTRAGQRVFFDAQGRQLTGAKAYKAATAAATL